MKAKLLSFLLLALGGCGGGGGGSSDPAPASPVVAPTASNTVRYTSSQPLIDNTASHSYNVLLMGNSHSIGLVSFLQTVLAAGQPGKTSVVQAAPGSTFLDERVNDGASEQALESEAWSHVVLQAQKYSSTGTNIYSTDAAEYWIRGSKEQGATPILFPEHPQRGNTWEGQYYHWLFLLQNR